MSGVASVGIPANVALTMVRGLLQFPYPQICRHVVAAEMLEALKSSGHAIPQGLIEAAWNAHDEEALALLRETA